MGERANKRIGERANKIGKGKIIAVMSGCPGKGRSYISIIIYV